MCLAGAAALALVSTGAAGVVAQVEPEVATGPDYAWVESVTQSNREGDPSQATGAYEGLTFILHGEGPAGDVGFHGLIYGGVAPPPLGELSFAMSSADGKPAEPPTE